MEGLPLVIISIEGLFFIAILITLMILVVRRLNIKEKEGFEKRDN